MDARDLIVTLNVDTVTGKGLLRRKVDMLCGVQETRWQWNSYRASIWRRTQAIVLLPEVVITVKPESNSLIDIKLYGLVLILSYTRAEPVPVCICPLAKPVPVCIYPFNGFWSFEYKS